MSVYAQMAGDGRLTLDELRALRYIAERGWAEVKSERSPDAPYAPAPLTSRAAHAIIGALSKVDAALVDAERRRRSEEDGGDDPLVIRALSFGPPVGTPRRVAGGGPAQGFGPQSS